MEPILKEIYDGIIDADQELVKEKVGAALSQGLDADTILNQGMVSAMTEVGRLFEEGEYFVPEMLICARAMQAGLSVLKPAMIAANLKSVGKVVAGTVKGDLHDIGKNLVCMMLEGAAFEIYDLGSDVSPQAFADKVKEVDADFVVMSALLTTTMPNMKATIEVLKEAGLRDKVKVLVGGAPLTTRYCEDIGADGYAADASRAVTLAKSLIGA
ncbi:MAG: corrinoid protein [Chloroflexi bacterium]|nr:corrinoid protein [Chloroflexota bacterium]